MKKSMILWRLFQINSADPNDRNAWYLIAEIFWASILISIATFNAAYAIRLGADNMQVSLLSSIPALMAVLVSYPAGMFFQRKARRKPWVFGSLLVYRAGFVLVALAPALNLFGISPGFMAVLVLVVISAPAHFFNVGWLPMLAEIVPEGRRAAIFAARNIITQATTALTVFAAGQWLDNIIFPMNYQVMYLFGFLASMVSMYYLFRMQIPDSPVRQQGHAAPALAAEQNALVLPAKTIRKGSRVAAALRRGMDGARGLQEELAGYAAFRRITVNTFLHGVGVWMAAPLYALYYVRQLDASDAWLGLNGTVAGLGTIAGFTLWRWLLSRWGEPISLKRTIVLVGLYPLAIGFTHSLPVILIYGVINGLIVPGVNLSHFNTLLKVTPPAERPRYTAIYMTVMNAGAFVSPLISVAIAEVIGLAPTLIVSGLLSVVGSTSFWWNPVVDREESGDAAASAGAEEAAGSAGTEAAGSAGAKAEA